MSAVTHMVSLPEKESNQNHKILGREAIFEHPLW